MKKNVPKFVIAKNEAASSGSTYIVHTQEPSFIAEVKRFETSQAQELYCKENSEIEIVIVNHKTIIEIKKYLTSPDHEKRRDYLNDRMRSWTIANFLITDQHKTDP